MKDHLTAGPAAVASHEAQALRWLPLFRAFRPKQWTKNGVVFAGIVFAGHLGEPTPLTHAFLAFVVFCALSSAVYIVNDIVDRDADRRHPIKRHRAIASGQVTVQLAWSAAALLMVMAAVGSIVLGPRFAAVGALYVLLNIAYSLRLKHEVILDVFSLAAGFVLRAAGGAVAVHVPISPWLYVCTVLLALFLGLSKRRYELLLLEDNAQAARRSLNDYSPALVEEMLSVVTSSTVIAYAMYTFFAQNVPHNHSMMLTLPFVLYGLFRYLFLVHTQRGAGNPDEVLLRDVPLLISIALWGITVVLILYGSRWMHLM